MDYKALILISGTLFLLVLATVLAEAFRKYRDYGLDTSILDTCRSRIKGWWLLFGGLTCALLIGPIATVLFFGLISFWAMREYITLTPTRPADHRTLFWIFFLCTPLQFVLVGINENWFRTIFGVGTYAVYSVLIPTYVFLILPASIAVSNDPKFFLERVAKIQVGLLICVYSLSFAPALLTTNFPISFAPAVTSEVFAEGLEDRVIAPLEKAVLSSQKNDSTLSPVKNPINDSDEKTEIFNSKNKFEETAVLKAKTLKEKSGPTADSKTTNKTSDQTVNKAIKTATGQVAPKSSDKENRSRQPLPSPNKKPTEKKPESSVSFTEPTPAEISPSFAVKPIMKPREMMRKTLSSANLSLLFVFVLLVQMSDIFQYLWSVLLKGRPIAPTINSNKTWAGVFCGAFTTALLAVALWYFTPFAGWWQPAVCGLAISLMGFAGSITMSAIKRDRGVADYGTLVEGHNGVLDRMDSLCFAAPVFYHLVWILLSLE